MPFRNPAEYISKAHTPPTLGSLADDFLMAIHNQMLMSTETIEVVSILQLPRAHGRVQKVRKYF